MQNEGKAKMTTFYDTYATAFSKSRFRIWPHVAQFLDTLPTNSRVLDIGCGNGKNMLYGTQKDLQMTGLEHSQSLCDICKERNLTVVQGDARSLPFTDNSFDAIIMIAVIHHINPKEHHQVLNEIKRVLRPGGTCLITNWAVEQPETNGKAPAPRTFTVGLNNVIWKGKEDQPLPYWVMDRSLAEEFGKTVPKGLKSNNLTWSAGNWEFWLQKITSESQDEHQVV
jgi:ubiquinone/menaquinone biosynthesis C-methylase UbiE